MLEVVSVALLYNTVEVVPFVDTHYKLPNKHKDYPIHTLHTEAHGLGQRALFGFIVPIISVALLLW